MKIHLSVSVIALLIASCSSIPKAARAPASATEGCDGIFARALEVEQRAEMADIRALGWKNSHWRNEEQIKRILATRPTLPDDRAERINLLHDALYASDLDTQLDARDALVAIARTENDKNTQFLLTFAFGKVDWKDPDLARLQSIVTVLSEIKVDASDRLASHAQARALAEAFEQVTDPQLLGWIGESLVAVLPSYAGAQHEEAQGVAMTVLKDTLKDMKDEPNDQKGLLALRILSILSPISPDNAIRQAEGLGMGMFVKSPAIVDASLYWLAKLPPNADVDARVREYLDLSKLNAFDVVQRFAALKRLYREENLPAQSVQRNAGALDISGTVDWNGPADVSNWMVAQYRAMKPTEKSVRELRVYGLKDALSSVNPETRVAARDALVEIAGTETDADTQLALALAFTSTPWERLEPQDARSVILVLGTLKARDGFTHVAQLFILLDGFARLRDPALIAQDAKAIVTALAALPNTDRSSQGTYGQRQIDVISTMQTALKDQVYRRDDAKAINAFAVLASIQPVLKAGQVRQIAALGAALTVPAIADGALAVLAKFVPDPELDASIRDGIRAAGLDEADVSARYPSLARVFRIN